METSAANLEKSPEVEESIAEEGKSGNSIKPNIKKEPVEDVDEEEEDASDPENVSPPPPSSPVSCCAVCGLGSPAESESNEESGGIGGNDMYRVLELFGFQFHKKIQWREDFEELPFCEECRGHCMPLLVLQAELDKLGQELYLGILAMKKLLEEAESRFQTNRVYQRDKRYYRLRRQLLGGKVLCPNVNMQNEPRRSSRSTKMKSKCKETTADSDDGEDVNMSADKDSNEGMVKTSDGKESVEQIKVEVDLEGLEDEEEEEDENMEDESYNPEQLDVDDKDYSPESIGDPLSSDSSSVSSSASDDEDAPPTPKPVKKSPTKRKSEKGYQTLKKKVKLGKCKRNRGRPAGKYSRPKLDKDPVTNNVKCLHVFFEWLAGSEYKCTQCSEVVTSESTLINHAVRAHTDRFVCNTCGQHKSSQSSLNHHIREVHEGRTRKPPPKSKECQICGKPFGNKVALQFHIITHYSEQDRVEAEARGEKLIRYKDKYPKVQCTTCGEMFCNVTLLKRHQIQLHSTNETQKDGLKRICPDCGKSFSDAYFKMHVERYHSGLDEEKLKPFMCSVCDMRFYTSAKLRNHKLIHGGERPHKCPYCGKGYVTTTLLKRHVWRTHENKRPFQCNLCPKAFVTSNHLQRHVLGVHEGKKQTYRKPEPVQSVASSSTAVDISSFLM